MTSSTERRWPARVLRALAGTILVVAALAGAAWWGASPSKPEAFYDPPSPLPMDAGSLLRSEPFTLDVPDGARAWRILYTTTRADGTMGTASAVVMIGQRPPPGPRPVLAWAHGTTGISAGCAPSMVRPFANVPALSRILDEGWVYVASDYAGLGTRGGHAYLIGDDTARAVLDAVRAARRLDGIALDGRAVVWGHSQGGGTALWTGIVAGDYAPDIALLGVAALAPASDLRTLFHEGRGSLFGKIVSAYMVTVYGRAYPDVRVEDYVPSNGQMLAQDMAGRCIGGLGTLLSVLESAMLPSDGLFARDPATGPLGERLSQNTPTRPIAAPVLIAQGRDDNMVFPGVQDRYVADRCAAGQPVDYRRYDGRDHLNLVADDSPLIDDLVVWTRARLAGAAPEPSCP
jgi:fermentation-respiration switch protein FrsA (DUF1100 family)